MSGIKPSLKLVYFLNLISLFLFLPIAIGGTSASVVPPQPDDGTDQLIVKMRDPSPRDISNRIRALGDSAGVALSHKREMSGSSHVVKLSKKLTQNEAGAVARRLAADPNVAFVEPDKKMHIQRLPNDPMFAQQWHYFETLGGINLPAAWDLTTGAPGIVIAVIDTGIRTHADLAGRVLPGYDFIGDLTIANDGDGRDGDASDPGDYCNGGSSSWHGTHVAGTLGAASNNSAGVSGINWTSKLLPVRVLGTCGGYMSDVIDGLRWASGISIPGVPSNPTPARVANLSLGGQGACSTSFQNAINDVVSRGTVVVVAAGNSAADAASFQPSGCAGVVAVAATARDGSKSGYSNFGSMVAISAPGGSSGNGILSTLNSGVTGPGADSYAFYQGTSMAAPHVAGTVSLMLSLNPNLTVTQVIQILKSSARPFPVGTASDCRIDICGAGIVDAGAAVRASANSPPPPTSPPTTLVNVALATNGGVATASSAYCCGFTAAGVNNGDRKGLNWGYGGGWHDSSANTFPDWLQIDLNGAKTISEIDVFTVQDNYLNPGEPFEGQTFSLYGITDFEVQFWDGAKWATVPGGSVSGNNKIWRKFTFAPISTQRVRILVTGALGSYSRVTELEVYETGNAPAPSPTLQVNFASQANGGVASATSVYGTGFSASGANNGDRQGLQWGSGGGWHSASADHFPEALQINFSGTKTISEVDVFTVQDAYTTPSEPTSAMQFTQYGITDFEIQYWNGTSWITVPGGSISGNRNVWRKLSFAPIMTPAFRILVLNALGSYSRITEVEAY